jgi:hypothetical protein
MRYLQPAGEMMLKRLFLAGFALALMGAAAPVDDVEILPGISAFVGSRHTFASQYLRVDGKLPFVLASDNVYFYRNLAEHKASATFSDADHAANIKAQERMIQLAGSVDRVVPGHDALQFQKFPTHGRVATIKQ